MKSIICICDAAVPNSFADIRSAACSKEKYDTKLYKLIRTCNLPFWSKKDV